MKEMITVSAKTLDEAITKALIELGTTSDNLEYTVIEKPSPGLFGLIGVKKAVIEARRKSSSVYEDDFENPTAKKEEKKAEKRVETKIDKTSENTPAAKKETNTDYSSYENAARDFLNNMFKVMDLEVDLEISYDQKDRELSINMNGGSMGVLIGKRGQTLDSLQYLISLVVNKQSEDYVRVKLDTENYRKRRKETLEVLARNVAYKVKRTKRSVSLEPMNPYERRVIHSALQHDKYIVTRSEGQEPYRRIVIALKRDNRENKY